MSTRLVLFLIFEKLPAGRSCRFFPFSVSAILVLCSTPGYLFFLWLYAHSIHICLLPDRLKQPNKKKLRKCTQKPNDHIKGHADCHAYRTLDPRRPVYDELSIHPPPRRMAGAPGEEVNQSGASLYTGKNNPHPFPML